MLNKRICWRWRPLFFHEVFKIARQNSSVVILCNREKIFTCRFFFFQRSGKKESGTVRPWNNRIDFTVDCRSNFYLSNYTNVSSLSSISKECILSDYASYVCFSFIFLLWILSYRFYNRLYVLLSNYINISDTLLLIERVHFFSFYLLDSFLFYFLQECILILQNL